ncbi:hypothetical protein [Microbacterium capsulatum]|uniref:Uncharacterized protein n=1 Tax=Microbacterium capsulatum TaxID=3041921 RepID=A0ABU0XJJ0_9MICO|nr:hypothetical protein [Microbacterium sp. ASV81]MDQ4215271.1 hypothetical protein [Microbacterium sp. ASV81]
MNPAEKVIELLDKIRAKIDEITRLVNAVLDHIPFFLKWVVDKLHEAWDRMIAKLGEFWDWFTDKLSYVGNPGLLNSASETWRSAAGKVSKINDTITASQLSVDDRWKGRAASQYEQSLEPQRRANTSILADYAENVASALSGLAGAIVAFWAAVVVAILTLLGALAGAAIATGTIIGLPAVPVLVTLGIVAFLAAAGFGVYTLTTAAGSSKSTLASTSAGISTWPKIATQ